jgi:hypothetical protein
MLEEFTLFVFVCVNKAGMSQPGKLPLDKYGELGGEDIFSLL